MSNQIASKYKLNNADYSDGKLELVPLYILLFFLVFKIRWGVYDLTILSAIIASGILLKSYKVTVLPKIWFPLLTVVGVYIYTILLTPIHTPETPFYVLKFSRVLVSIVSTYIIVIWLIKRYKPVHVLYALGLILALHPAIMYLEIISTQFSNLWIGIQQNYNPGLASVIVDHRTIGLLNGHPPAGNFLGISSLYFAFMLMKYRSKLFLLIYIGIIPLFPASGVLGLILYSMTFVILLGYLAMEEDYSTLLLIITIFVFIAISSIIIYLSGLGDSVGINRAFDRIAVVFDSDVDSPSNPAVSFYKTLERYELPPEITQFFFGNLEPFGSAASTTISHAGFILNIHAFGLIGFCLLLLSVFSFVGKSRSVFLLFFTMLWLVLFLKNDHIHGRIFFDYFYICFILSISGIDEYERFFEVQSEASVN